MRARPVRTTTPIQPAPASTPYPVYDPLEPARLQENDWDCSVESIEWCLFAWGRTPDDNWLENSMIAAGVVDPAVGCTDSSGAGLARWVNTEYGEYGYAASNSTRITFEQARDEARTLKHPCAIGGASWYHWSGLRGYDPINDRLLLANPAPGWHSCYQTMTRQQFADLGPFNIVRVTHPEAESGGSSPSPSPTAVPVGPDVASYQGTVNWPAVRAAGCAFGFSKATGGAWYTNPTFAANWAGMQAAGLQRGAYHFAFEMSGQPFPGPGPEAEANFFLDTVLGQGTPLSPGDMLVLDIEQGAGDLGEWALRWLERVRDVVGFAPLLYTGKWFSDPHGFAAVPGLREFPLWLADYSASTLPPPVQPWTRTSFWQFTDEASVPGITGPCDGNRFNGALSDLPSYGMPKSSGTPDDSFAPWRGLVGSGLLELMAQDNTLPAQRSSTWLPLGVSPADIEQCAGQNGINYVWQLVTSKGLRYAPL